MEFINKVYEAVKKDRKRIVLPEGEEERNLLATAKIREEGLAEIILIGSEEVIKANAERLNAKHNMCNLIINKEV